MRNSTFSSPETVPRPDAAFRRGAAARGRLDQRGAGMAEFLIVLIPVLLLGLGGVELAHWMTLRQTLSLVLVEAARVGATRQANPQAIADAFEHGLRMTHPDPRALARALTEQRRALGFPWRIHIVQPSPVAFADHADPDVKGPRAFRGQPLIRNDYQALQQARRQAQGWPQGRGPRSGVTIHEANTLVMELGWPQRPLLPGMTVIVRALAPLSDDALNRRMMTAGYLPFRRQVSIAMQSHPALWPALADGRILYVDDSAPGPTNPRPPKPPPIATPDAGDPGGTNQPPSGADTLPPWPLPDESSTAGSPGTSAGSPAPGTPDGGPDVCQPGP